MLYLLHELNPFVLRPIQTYPYDLTQSVSLQERSTPYQPGPLKVRFLSDFREVSLRLYSFHAQDVRHALRYAVRLEVQDFFYLEENKASEEETFIPTVVCDFFPIDGRELYEKVQGNQYLYENLIGQFYLYILESFFLFCEEKGVDGLILHVDEIFRDLIKIYCPFIYKETEVYTEKGKKIQLLIPTNTHGYEALISYRNKVSQDFYKGLWEQQNQDPKIREYLKAFALEGEE